MNILWLCRWFGDYRIPLYRELNHLSSGNFHMAYSKEAVSSRVHEKMQLTLGENAFGLDGEHLFSLGNLKSNFANKGIEITIQTDLIPLIKKINPDILVSDGFFQWTMPALLMSRHRKLCLFYERTAHTERLCPAWRTWYRKIVGKCVDGFLINGSETRLYLERLGLDHVPYAEGCMVADTKGLESSVKTFSGDSEFKKQHQCQSGLLFLFVGQLVERKGIVQLLEAWQIHVKSFPLDSLFILGEGTLHEMIVNRFGNVPGVQFFGGIDYDSIHEFYSAADVFLMPTLEDNWSLVIPEAMACGKPVATTPYNGCHAELVHDGENGYLFDSLSHESITSTLARFHHSDLCAMGSRSLQIIQKYTPEKAAARIYSLLTKIMKHG